MADLFLKQAKQYAETRPGYPPELFHFVSSKTPTHHVAWDVGTGSGQAATSLSLIYRDVIATDTSQKQLDFAPKLSNVRYQQTPPNMSLAELSQKVAPQSSVDLVTIAQSIHWFDLPIFYQQVKWVLKKPDGVIAAWCYTTPQVNESVDAVFKPFYLWSQPNWELARKLVDEKYMGLDFPFEAVDGLDKMGPYEFVSEKVMDLEGFFSYIRSWSAYQSAKDKGEELLKDDWVEKFKLAWDEDGCDKKLVKFPVYLRIGKVGKISEDEEKNSI